jgi:cell division septation protein DedD
MLYTGYPSVLRRLSLFAWLVFQFIVPSSGQSVDDEVRSYVEKLDRGQSAEVRQILSDLSTRYQNNPGVTFLQARLTTNAIEAVKLYQSIVDNFPKSEWSDDALYRIYQYYYSMGLYKTADLKLQQLKKDYPASEFVTGKKEVKTPLKEEPVRLPPKEIVVDSAEIKAPPPPVTERTPDIQSPAPVPAEKKPLYGKYTLQVGAFSSAENAGKQKSFLESKGFNVDVTSKVRGGKTLYIVLLGTYPDLQEARKMKDVLKTKHSIDSMVVER